MKGRRERMEDEYLVDYEPSSDEGFFGVFDGHNGMECAEFLKKNWVAKFKEQEALRKGRKHSVERALRRTTEALDAAYLKMAEKKDWVAGSTATVVFFRRNELYVAHTGDSRCVAVINGRPWSLSTDHKPDDPAEKKRYVILSGEKRRRESGCSRVLQECRHAATPCLFERAW